MGKVQNPSREVCNTYPVVLFAYSFPSLENIHAVFSGNYPAYWSDAPWLHWVPISFAGKQEVRPSVGRIDLS